MGLVEDSGRGWCRGYGSVVLQRTRHPSTISARTRNHRGTEVGMYKVGDPDPTDWWYNEECHEYSPSGVVCDWSLDDHDQHQHVASANGYIIEVWPVSPQ